MNRNSTWLIVLLTCSLTSCASLFKGTRADITFTGPTDEPVNIISSRDTFKQRQLPTTIQVKKANLQNAITVESDNYRFSRLVPGRKIDWWSVAQVLGPFGLTGVVVDGITGAINLPKQKIYPLTYAAKTDTVTPLPSVVGVEMEGGKNPWQFFRHELNLTLGFGNADDKACNQLFDELYDNYHIEGSSIHIHTSLSGSYFYHFNRHWALGGLFGLNHFQQEPSNWRYTEELEYDWWRLSEYWLYQGDLGKALFYRELKAPVNEGTFTHQMYYAMPAVRYTWMAKVMEIYSGVSIGIAYRRLSFKGDLNGTPFSIDRSHWKVGAQITLIGARWSKEHWGVFCELGVGHQGTLLGGISYRF